MPDHTIPIPARSALIRVLDGDRVALRRRASTTIVDRGDVISAHSEGNTTRVITRPGEFILCESLAAVVECLTSIGVVQIHRSAAVASNRVRQLVGGGHRFFVILDDGRHLAVGRGFQRAIRRHFGAITE